MYPLDFVYEQEFTSLIKERYTSYNRLKVVCIYLGFQAVVVGCNPTTTGTTEIVDTTEPTDIIITARSFKEASGSEDKKKLIKKKVITRHKNMFPLVAVTQKKTG